MNTPAAPPTPQQHAERIRAALAALNDAVRAAAADGVGVTYDERLDASSARVAPRVLRAQVWWAL